MSLLVRPCHHHRFRAVLNDSFRLRREAFEPGRTADSGLEQDSVDGNAAHYLVRLDSAARAIATARVTPGAAGGLACDRLAAQMSVALPRGPHVVELSRLCVDPRLGREARVQALVELRACIGLLFLRHGWTFGVAVGHDRHIQPFILAGMTVQVLGPPALLPGDSQLSFAVLIADPDRLRPAGGFEVVQPFPLQDPDEDPSLFTRYGDRAVA